MKEQEVVSFKVLVGVTSPSCKDLSLHLNLLFLVLFAFFLPKIFILERGRGGGLNCAYTLLVGQIETNMEKLRNDTKLHK